MPKFCSGFNGIVAHCMDLFVNQPEQKFVNQLSTKAFCKSDDFNLTCL